MPAPKPVFIRAAQPGGPAGTRALIPDRPFFLRAAALAVFSGFVIATVLYLSQFQWLCALVLLAGCAAVIFWERRRWWSVLKMMLVAGVLGAVGEWLCVRKFNLWQYHFPVFKDGLPVWIGLVWSYLYALFILIAEIFEDGWRRLGDPIKNFLAIGFGVVFFLFLREVFLHIDRNISYYYILFLAIGLSIWRAPADTLTLIVAGIGGTVGEYMSIRHGLWHYTNPVFPASGMPISLPLAWGLAAVFVRNAAMRFWHSTLWLLAGTGLLAGAIRVFPEL